MRHVVVLHIVTKKTDLVNVSLGINGILMDKNAEVKF